MRDSKIEWCDHTFNPWWGCEKISAGCKHCYAEAALQDLVQLVNEALAVASRVLQEPGE